MPTVAVYLVFWLVLMVLMIGNGIIREMTYGKVLPELQAHQLSTATGMFIAGAAVWILSLRRVPGSARSAIGIGLVWLVWTVTFEFVFGRMVAGHSWQQLIQDYNVLEGRVWGVFLLWISAIPFVVFRLRGQAGEF